MTEVETLQARIEVLETALVEYIYRYGLTETGRKAMIGVDRGIHGQGLLSR